MTTTSHYWRQDLARRAEKLHSKEEQSHWGEQALCILEQVVVLGFYAIRRLELSGLSDPKKMKHKYKLKEFAYQTSSNQHSNSKSKDELYHMDKGKAVEKDVAFIEHQLAHSSYFESVFDKEKRPQSVYFTSDHQKSKALYQIQLQDIIEIFEDFSQLEIMG